MRSIIFGFLLALQSFFLAAVAQEDDLFLSDEDLEAAVLALGNGRVEDTARPCKISFQNQQWSAAASACKISAEGGDAESQYNLGVLYMLGAGGLPKNASTSAGYLQAASNKGHLDAHIALGELHKNGADGFPSNYAKAWSHYQTAATQNLSLGYTGLAEMTEKGLGRPKDKVQAVKYYLEAKRRNFRTVKNARAREQTMALLDDHIKALRLEMLSKFDNERRLGTYVLPFQPPNLNDSTWNINRHINSERQRINDHLSNEQAAVNRNRQRLFDTAKQLGINVTKTSDGISIRGDQEVNDLYLKIFGRYNSEWDNANSEANSRLEEINRWVDRVNGR